MGHHWALAPLRGSLRSPACPVGAAGFEPATSPVCRYEECGADASRGGNPAVERDSEIRRGKLDSRKLRPLPARLGTAAQLRLLLGKRRAHALNELLTRDHAVGM
jgi:hypothetical protein